MPSDPLVGTVIDTVLTKLRAINGGTSWHTDLSGDDRVIFGDDTDILTARDLVVLVAADPLEVSADRAMVMGGWEYRLTLRVIGRTPAQGSGARARWDAAAKLQRDLTKAINADPSLGYGGTYGLVARAEIGAYGGDALLGSAAIPATVSGTIVVEWHETEAP